MLSLFGRKRKLSNKKISENIKNKVFGEKYYFFKPMFYSGIALMVISFVILAFSYGLHPIEYFHCDEQVSWCEYNEGLVPGGFTVGSPAPFIVRYWDSLCFGLFGLLFGLNHLIFNKNNKR